MIYPADSAIHRLNNWDLGNGDRVISGGYCGEGGGGVVARRLPTVIALYSVKNSNVLNYNYI